MPTAHTSPHHATPLRCPYCGGHARLRSSAVVYRRTFGYVYLCEHYPRCDAYVGCHPGTTRPLGRLADAALRRWKRRAHAAFDPLWRSGRMTRRDAYRVLQHLMGLDETRAHIGQFDIDQCRLLIARLQRHAHSHL